jgi:hypothetical protein
LEAAIAQREVITPELIDAINRVSANPGRYLNDRGRKSRNPMLPRLNQAATIPVYAAAAKNTKSAAENETQPKRCR